MRSVEAMIMADKTNQKSLSKRQYEAGPAHVIAQIEALLRQLHAKAVLNVPDSRQSARLFAALIKGSDLLIIARFDEARAEDANEIESYCRSAVAMFLLPRTVATTTRADNHFIAPGSMVEAVVQALRSICSNIRAGIGASRQHRSKEIGGKDDDGHKHRPALEQEPYPQGRDPAP
ncbi:AefR-like transcriptional repressor, C-terminal region [Pseudomonas sp. NFACC45]|nr:AefR-like transcriptional repressor, C-terminal region [Pseudomonas sp. NFACC45]